MALADPRSLDLPPTVARAPAGAVERYSFLLLLRFGLVNLTGLALVAAAWAQGWLDPVIAADRLHLCALIAAVFLVGLGRATEKAWMLSDELNGLAAGGTGHDTKAGAFLRAASEADATGRATLAAMLRLKLGQRIAGVRHIANALVLLGLIGTVVGFVLALGGVNPSRAGDAAAIAPMVSTLIEGMSVALYTTLVGSLLNIWLMLDYRLLEAGAVHLLTRLVELGERHARP
jgi:hypothetical protein